MTHQLSPTMVGFLDILSDGQRHGGTEVAKVLGVSRAAIWKVVQCLKKYKVAIQSEHLGYRLQSPLVLLERAKIQKLLNRDVTIDIFEKLPSTNDYLKALTLATSPHICLAEYQIKGRGRLGRSWDSPFGRNIYCSISYVFQKDFSELSGLSLAVGVLTAKALESINHQFHPCVKWPNDIYMQQRKVGGILIDLLAEANGTCKAIIGIGLNVNMKGLKLENLKNWTCLEDASDQYLDRNEIVARLLNSLLQGMDIFSDAGLEPFLSDWERLDFLDNKKVSLVCEKTVHSGTARGITHEGLLRLELPTGIETFSYGDTRLQES